MTSTTRRQVGYGVQGAVGSGVVIDSNLRCTCTLRPIATKVFPEEDIGQYGRNRSYISEIHGEGNIKMDATYEQIIVPLCLAMPLGVPEGSSGNGAPYTWAHGLQFRTAPSSFLTPFTLEYIDEGPSNGGAGTNGTYVVRMVDCFSTGLTISGNAGETWQVEAELSGREVTLPDSLSGNPEPDMSVTPIRMAETTLAVDALYANIGDTGVTEFISFNWKLEDNLHSKQFAGSFFPNGWGSGRWIVTLELVLEISAAAAQVFADQAITETICAVRIKGYIDANDSCNIDGMYTVMEVGTLDDRDGNNIIKVTLAGITDITGGNTGGVTVINDVAAL